MGGAELRIIMARFGEAKLPVYGEADFVGVRVPLAIVFPPADGAQVHGIWRQQRFEAATGATETDCRTLHERVDEN